MSEPALIPAWSEVAAELIAVAARRAPADLVIRDCAWVNVHSREVLPGSRHRDQGRALRLLRAGRRRR